MRYTIQTELRLVITIGWDIVTSEEIKAHQDQLLADPAFGPEFHQLIDSTHASEFAVTADEAMAIALRRLFSESSRRAFVATSPGIFGMARLMQAYNEMSSGRSQVSVFYDRDEALKWLGVEDCSSLETILEAITDTTEIPRPNAD